MPAKIRSARTRPTADPASDAHDAPARREPFSYRILHAYPPPSEERGWREFLDRADLPSHYTAPEYFLEPYWASTPPFAVPALDGSKVAAVLTGIRVGRELVSASMPRLTGARSNEEPPARAPSFVRANGGESAGNP